MEYKNLGEAKSNIMSNTFIPVPYKNEATSDVNVDDLMKGFGESDKMFGDG